MKRFSFLVSVPNTYNTEQAKQVNPLWDKTIEQWKADGVYILSFAFPGRGSQYREPKNPSRKKLCFLGRVYYRVKE
jgi:hypothetical protein